MTERIEVTVNGTLYTVEVDDLGATNGTPIEVRVNGRAYTVQTAKPAPQAPAAQPQPAAAPAPQPAAPKKPAAAPASGGKGEQVTAPMPGKILSVLVQEGDQVQEKQTLCTLEAMKMEMTVAAPVSGRVRQVRAQVGENVVFGDLLVVIE